MIRLQQSELIAHGKPISILSNLENRLVLMSQPLQRWQTRGEIKTFRQSINHYSKSKYGTFCEIYAKNEQLVVIYSYISNILIKRA